MSTHGLAMRMAQEIQGAGAFYETRNCSLYALTPLRGTLPGEDRRDATVRDRRGNLRGGWRAWDEAPNKLA